MIIEDDVIVFDTNEEFLSIPKYKRYYWRKYRIMFIPKL